MIIIKDDNNKEQMRYDMREYMRRNYNNRTSTHYKDDDAWKEGYEKGYKDACEDKDDENFRRKY